MEKAYTIKLASFISTMKLAFGYSFLPFILLVVGGALFGIDEQIFGLPITTLSYVLFAALFGLFFACFGYLSRCKAIIVNDGRCTLQMRFGKQLDIPQEEMVSFKIYRIPLELLWTDRTFTGIASHVDSSRKFRGDYDELFPLLLKTKQKRYTFIIDNGQASTVERMVKKRTLILPGYQPPFERPFSQKWYGLILLIAVVLICAISFMLIKAH